MASRASWGAIGASVGVVAIIALLRWIAHPTPGDAMALMGDDFAAYRLTFGSWPKSESELRAHLTADEVNRFDDLASNQLNYWKLTKPEETQAIYAIAGTDVEHPVLRTFTVHANDREREAMEQRRPFALQAHR